jgi:hypothetical protein
MFRARPSIPRLFSRWSGTTRLCLQARCYATKPRGQGRPKNLKDHFTPEKLATSDQYPLTHELVKVMHPSMLEHVKKKKAGPGQKLLGRVATTTASTHVRSQIVSPDLCGMLCLGRAYCRALVLTVSNRRCSKTHWTYPGRVQGLRHPRHQSGLRSMVAEAPCTSPAAQPRPPRT